jgi:hypothetical protein
MGLWDKVKSVALSAKCMTGWHAGEYEHVEGKPLCFLGKTCPDCGEYVTKNKHAYNEWEYFSYDSCNAQRNCIHCNHIEQAVQHQYKEQGKDESCRIIEVCQRCGDKKIGSAKHNWVTIPFTDTEMKSGGKRKCQDCGYMG